jgi:hypothetical protein
MTGYKETLHHYLRVAREAMLWKLDGLGEYDVRRPLTPTGTNLLGLVKHLALVEAGYFGVTFGRPVADQLPGWGDDEPDTDMWAAPGESRELAPPACAATSATCRTATLPGGPVTASGFRASPRRSARAEGAGRRRCARPAAASL